MISLFTGIETFGWQKSDFDNLISFCKQNGIDQVVLKVYEITQGEWYRNLGGSVIPIGWLVDAGLEVLPYGFFYGDSPDTEAQAANMFLSLFGDFCLDMESSFDGNTGKMQAFVNALVGQFYVSTWANPLTHSWIGNITILEPKTKAWMPQAYDDSLVKAMYDQWPRTLLPIEPTFHVQNTPVNDAKSFSNNFSLWEYELAKQSPGQLVQFVNISRGVMVSNYPTNAKGMICNPLPITEFQPQHSEFECGAFSVSILMRSTNYNAPNNYSLANGIAWAEAEYKKMTGSNDPSNMAGASVNDMHVMLKDTQADPNPASHLHYWDIAAINASSQQDHDIAEIKAALQHGYPVLATVSEASVFDLDLGRNPYWWGPTGNHILAWVGIAPDGNLLAADPANVVRGDGNLQTPKSLQPWPRRYAIKSIDNQWASAIMPSWIGVWPNNSGDPLTWPPYQPPAPSPVPPPNPGPTPPITQDVTMFYDATNKQLVFVSNSQVIYRVQL